VSTQPAVVAEWIRRIVDDERQRDAVSAREKETATRKADLVRAHGRRLINELHTALARDVGVFRDEFAGDRARDVVCGDVQPDGRFEVSKPDAPAVSLTIAPQFDAASVSCGYHFRFPGGLPPREVRFDLVFEGEGMGTLQLKHHGTAQVFTSADALSEYLLVPVFTGRPRSEGGHAVTR
jgi:hypothetical protein